MCLSSYLTRTALISPKKVPCNIRNVFNYWSATTAHPNVWSMKKLGYPVVLIYLPLRDVVSCQITLQASFVQRLSNFIHILSSSLWNPFPPPPTQITLNITPHDKYLDNNWSSHHSINDWFSEWIKLPVRPSHEIRLEKIPTEYHKTIVWLKLGVSLMSEKPINS